MTTRESIVLIDRHPNGRGYQLITKVFLRRELEDVFEFFSDAFQLERITPPWLHFRVTTPAPIHIEEGTIIDYRLRLHGIPIRWQSCISVWEPPYRFVDQQILGPYRWWRHEHRFAETECGVMMQDVVDYHVPLAFIAHPMLVKNNLRHIFEFRALQIQQQLSP